MPSLDTAGALLTFAGGPSLVGTGALLTYARSVVGSDRRTPRRGWLALGAGLLLVCWLVLFFALAVPTVFASWTATGPVEPTLVLLSATWIATLALTVVTIAHAPRLIRYLRECYHPDDLPWVLRPWGAAAS